MFRKFVAVSTLALAAAACADTPTSPSAATQPRFGQQGNGFPSGAHYTLNIIGVDHDKTAAMDGATGGRIFVKLYYDDGRQDGQCWEGACPVDMKVVERYNKILLQPGTDFQVLDANATDKDGALFQLPEDVSTTYRVYARPLGTPGGELKRMVTCGTFEVDPDGIANSGDEYSEVACSTNEFVTMREKGRSMATEVTDKLLFITLTVDPDDTDTLTTCLANTGRIEQTDGDDAATSVTLPLFDGCLQNYFWDYDNNGLKLLQLRFYPVTA